MQFHLVAEFFQEIENISSRTEMTAKLAHLFKQASPKEAQHLAYFCLGTLNPPYIHTQFGIARKTMVKICADVLDQTESQIVHAMSKLGDLGTVYAEHAIKQRKGDIAVEQLYKRLQEIEQTGGTGSQEKKQQHCIDLLSSVSPLEGKFIIRIILGTLRLGFSDMTLIDALSVVAVGDKKAKKEIEEAYNYCADLGLVAAHICADGLEGIKKTQVEVGIPIRMAAAERLPTAAEIVEKLGDCVAEPKLDGFRLQIHKGKEHGKSIVRFFSRNLVDMSDSFPDLVDAVEALPAHDLIMEGEAIAFNPDTGEFVPFQETVKRKRKHGIEAIAEELPLRVFVFDMLYLNGELLLGKTLRERRALIKHIVGQRADATLTMVQEVPMRSAKQLEDYFYEQIGKGLEGVMVKRSDAPYQPGKRNFNWIKLKRQEHGELEDTLDCVILGYYAGRGKRARFGIGAFLVGIYNPQKDEYETVAKIGTGLSDEQWKQLKHDLDALAVLHKPILVNCSEALYPDVWVEPKRVVLVRADEITRSPLHTACRDKEQYGLALRFPRYMGDRPDKKADEATTNKELLTLFKQQHSRK